MQVPAAASPRPEPLTLADLTVLPATAFVSNITSLNYAPYAYTAYAYGPFMCWKGNISAVPPTSSFASSNFFESNANPTARTDYISGQIKPCAGDANMYVAPGFTLNAVVGSGFNYSGKVYMTGAGASGPACSADISTVVAVTAAPPSCGRIWPGCTAISARC